MGQSSSAGRGPVLAFVYDRQASLADGVLGLHLEVCRGKAVEAGWSVVGEWVDRGTDALSDSARPQFDAMVKVMGEVHAAGRSVVCLVADWGRLSRDEEAEGGFRTRVRAAGGHTSTVAGETDEPGRLHPRSRALR